MISNITQDKVQFEHDAMILNDTSKKNEENIKSLCEQLDCLKLKNQNQNNELNAKNLELNGNQKCLNEIKCDNAEKNPELEEFGNSNGFCGSFRTSAKTGLNINESMEYLIKNIIQRMEAMQSKGNEVFTTDRKSVALDPEKHNEVAQKRKQKDGCC